MAFKLLLSGLLSHYLYRVWHWVQGTLIYIAKTHQILFPPERRSVVKLNSNMYLVPWALRALPKIIGIRYLLKFDEKRYFGICYIVIIIIDDARMWKSSKIIVECGPRVNKYFFDLRALRKFVPFKFSPDTRDFRGAIKTFFLNTREFRNNRRRKFLITFDEQNFPHHSSIIFARTTINCFSTARRRRPFAQNPL